MRFFLFINLISFLSFNQSFSQTVEATFSEKHIEPVINKAFDQNSQFILAAAAGSVLLTNPSDDSIRDQWKNNQKMNKDMSKAGDLMGSGLGGAVVLASQYFFDDDRDHWISHARALVWGTTVSSIMKVAIGRPRPGNSDSHHSFPSGHTTTAFTTATSLTYAYGWKAAVIAYPLATWVGLSRLADDAHWGSDVVAGAFLGFWVARACDYSTSEIEDHKRKSVFIPQVQDDGLAINWLYSF